MNLIPFKEVVVSCIYTDQDQSVCEISKKVSSFSELMMVINEIILEIRNLASAKSDAKIEIGFLKR